jgi:APA family basic amino acid/polyamine antiporter
VVSYLSPLQPWIHDLPGASVSVSLFLIWLLTLVNWYGIKASGWVQSVTTVLKILPLIAVSVLGVATVRGNAVAGVAQIPLSVGGVTAAATLTLWALLGLESATIPADKVANPGRTIPLATLVGTVATALICVIACTTVLLLVPPATLAESNAPFVDLTSRYWGSSVGKLVAVFAAISAFGALNGWILLQGELPRAMAASGVFPRIFARESVHQTPGFGLCVGSAVATFLVLVNYQKSMVGIFTFMALLSTTACLVMYALCSAALLRLQWTQQLGAARRGSVPLAIVGIIATAYSLWAIIGAGADAVLWGAALLLAGVPLYYSFRSARQS